MEEMCFIFPLFLIFSVHEGIHCKHSITKKHLTDNDSIKEYLERNSRLYAMA